MAYDDQDPTKPIPTTGPGAFQAGQNALQTGLGALGKTQQIAGQTGDLWGGIQATAKAQTQTGLDALKQQAARAVYANRGSLGGGGGLAALQQNNAGLATSAGEFNTQANAQQAQLAQQGQQAQLAAQGQIASAAGGQYRILQDQQQRQTRLQEAMIRAQEIMSRYAGTIYTSSGDKQKAANQINTEVLANESDPTIIAAIKQYQQNLLNGSEVVPNTLNV